MDGAKLIRIEPEYEGNFLFEYSWRASPAQSRSTPWEVRNAVLDVMQPTPDRPMIINLPVTVEMSMPHIYANQIEWCSKHLKYRDAWFSPPSPQRPGLRRGAELAVLAGAQRGWSAASSATGSVRATWTPSPWP